MPLSHDHDGTNQSTFIDALNESASLVRGIERVAACVSDFRAKAIVST